MEMDAVWLSPVGRLIEGKERKALIRQGGVRFRSKLGTDPMVIWNREGCPVYAPEAGRERERERGERGREQARSSKCRLLNYQELYISGYFESRLLGAKLFFLFKV